MNLQSVEVFLKTCIGGYINTVRKYLLRYD